MLSTPPSHSRILIVGGGLAGLFCALKLAPIPVTVLVGTPIGEGSSSSWAQGGIAAALSVGDSPALHAQDTIKAGYGLVDPHAALTLAKEAAERVQDLLAYGVPFDQDTEGHLLQSKEAAHSHRRVARVKGDLAGKEIMAALIKAVHNTPSIHLVQGYSAQRLIMQGQRVVGLYARDQHRHLHPFYASAILLATGGIGHLYAITTNPSESRGIGLAMAARVGAQIADPEFVQFHPTAIHIQGLDPAPLATEALRGEGAMLVNDREERFMSLLHKEGDLAPRDIVARAIFAHIHQGRSVFLDARYAIGADFPDRFPAVFASCQAAHINPITDLIPIAPAEHYHMGGIWTDEQGRSSLQGLWAAGEVACTGVHGANRLASNSLLEAAVFATRVAQDMLASSLPPPSPPFPPLPSPYDPPPEPELLASLRALCSRSLGVIRQEKDLVHALCELTRIMGQTQSEELRNMCLTALFIAVGASQRQESRGAHFRTDFPQENASLAHHTFLTLEKVQKIVQDVLDAEGGGDQDARWKM